MLPIKSIFLNDIKWQLAWSLDNDGMPPGGTQIYESDVQVPNREQK